jgi:hypothetical protein
MTADTVVIVDPAGQKMTVHKRLLKTYTFNGWKVHEEPEVFVERYDFSMHTVGDLRHFARMAGVKWYGLIKTDLIRALDDMGYKPPIEDTGDNDGTCD